MLGNSPDTIFPLFHEDETPKWLGDVSRWPSKVTAGTPVAFGESVLAPAYRQSIRCDRLDVDNQYLLGLRVIGDALGR